LGWPSWATMPGRYFPLRLLAIAWEEASGAYLSSVAKSIQRLSASKQA
jgi:hypothetical protein